MRAITRVGTAVNEDELVQVARAASAVQLDRLCAGIRNGASLDDVNARHRRRRLSYRVEEDGSVCFSVRSSPEDGAEILEALRRAQDYLERTAASSDAAAHLGTAQLHASAGYEAGGGGAAIDSGHAAGSVQASAGVPLRGPLSPYDEYLPQSDAGEDRSIAHPRSLLLAGTSPGSHRQSEPAGERLWKMRHPSIQPKGKGDLPLIWPVGTG